jgi:hypothetical protein
MEEGEQNYRNINTTQFCVYNSLLYEAISIGSTTHPSHEFHEKKKAK